MFKPVETRKKYSDMEKEVTQFWKDNTTFERSVENRPKKDRYVFYDGPPFITGVPHYGTLLSSIIKDVVPRYWTMKGKRVERVWGWDCHGLPAENLVEKKLGIKDKRDVAKVGLEKYIETCHAEMVQGGSQWEESVDRIGRWVDLKGAYKTMDKEYMESVWWAFKQLYEKNLIYEGEKVLMYCTRCATPISKAEVAMDNSYQDVTDPSVFVKFKLAKNSQLTTHNKEDITSSEKAANKNVYLLAWTTTPWTLPANTGLAINAELTYVKVEFDNDVYILAKETIEKVFIDEKNKPLDYKEVGEIDGKELEGLEYEPLFDHVGSGGHRVLLADYVTIEEGTGIVHLAPAFGEEDYELAKKEHLPLTMNVDGNGLFVSGRWEGKNVWEVNKEIAKTLHAEGNVLRIAYVQHSYPHCHRCGTKLMYRSHPSWFMNIKDQKEKMLEMNENIHWYPEHFKEGRFKNTVETAPDWNLSRDRFWATPMPVWKGKKEDGTEVVKVVGSYTELEELSGKALKDYHRPYIDDITFEHEGVTMKRIDKVMDCWFESGSMPFAQFHYPFENKEKFEENFPGDFIAEYVGQVRAWFYYLHAISVGLFGQHSFKNVIVTGTIAGNDGKKMSKSLGNYTDPTVLLDEYSADALRYLLVTSPLLRGNDYSLVDKDVKDVQRRLLSTLWNSYSFFVMYANIDGWKPSVEKSKFQATSLLDKWIVSELNQLIGTVDENMQKYDLVEAARPIENFVDNLSNWYIRRSRRRFWKSEDDGDKKQAYETLHYVLVELSKLIAPFTPFIAEEIYKNLTGEESVHLEEYPKTQQELVNKDLNQQMREVRDIISIGLQLRSQAGIKVRQPLQKVVIEEKKVEGEYGQMVMEELNVKEVISVSKGDATRENYQKGVALGQIVIAIDTNITEDLKLEGQAREVIRFIQAMRKEADYEVDDRIAVSQTGGEKIFKKFGDMIASEVLAKDTEFTSLEECDLEKTLSLEDVEVIVRIKK